MTTYTTKQAADMVGMHVSQLHYYDKLGLIPNLQRGSNGYRQFSNENIVWLKNLNKFISSGMQLKNLQQLTKLVQQGKTRTLPKRRAIVTAHLNNLYIKQNNLAQQITFMEDFLSEYDHLEKES